MLCESLFHQSENSKGKSKEIRNLKYFVAEHFIHDLSNMPWEDIENIDNPNVAWKFWESNFKTVLDRHAPIRHKLLNDLLSLG